LVGNPTKNQPISTARFVPRPMGVQRRISAKIVQI
jgi:hypothetical protein